MYYPYCTIQESIEVVHTPLKNGYTTVHFEKPDKIYGFKTLDCVIPSYRVNNIVGFSDTEVSELVTFCRNNASLLLKYASEGGIANA